MSNPNTEKWTSLCPRCLKEVSNKAYFSGPKGSAHFRGTCSLPQPSIPDRTFDKPMPYPMPRPVNYNAGQFINRTWERIFPVFETLSDVAKWWGLPTIGETQQKKTTKGSKALAKMGLAA